MLTALWYLVIWALFGFLHLGVQVNAAEKSADNPQEYLRDITWAFESGEHWIVILAGPLGLAFAIYMVVRENGLSGLKYIGFQLPPAGVKWF